MANSTLEMQCELAMLMKRCCDLGPCYKPTPWRLRWERPQGFIPCIDIRLPVQSIGIGNTVGVILLVSLYFVLGFALWFIFFFKVVLHSPVRQSYRA